VVADLLPKLIAAEERSHPARPCGEQLERAVRGRRHHREHTSDEVVRLGVERELVVVEPVEFMPAD
jgi:hypothetical protein